MNRLVSTLCTVTLVTTLAGCLGDDSDTANGLNGLRPNKPDNATPTTGRVRTVDPIETGIAPQLFDRNGVKLAEGTYSQVIENPPGTPGLCTGCSATVVHDVIEAEPGMFIDTVTVYGQTAALCQIAFKRLGIKATVEFDTCNWFAVE